MAVAGLRRLPVPLRHDQASDLVLPTNLVESRESCVDEAAAVQRRSLQRRSLQRRRDLLPAGPLGQDWVCKLWGLKRTTGLQTEQDRGGHRDMVHGKLWG